MAAPPVLQRFIPRASQLASHFTRTSASYLNTRTPFVTPSTYRTNFSTSSIMSHDSTSFKDAVQTRRSIYQLTKSSTVPDARIKEILTTALEDVPSSFNSQSTRLVVLLKEEHTKFWEIVTEILKAHVPADKWAHTEGRLNMFHNSYGTVLFYEDPEPIQALAAKFPTYADKFPQWSEHTSAMHQYMLWTAFEAEGLGCNLQHYNPLPDQKAAAEWKIPLEWSLKAQLVFGKPAEGAREGLAKKERQPLEGRLFVHGA